MTTHSTVCQNCHNTPYCPLELPQRTQLFVTITTAHPTAHRNYRCTPYCLSELPQHTLLSIRITTAHCTVHHNYHSTLFCPSELPQHTVLPILLPQYTVLSIRITTALCPVHQIYHSTLYCPLELPQHTQGFPTALPKTVTLCCLLLHCLNPCILTKPLGSTPCLSDGLILSHCCFGTVLSALDVFLLLGWIEGSSSVTVWRETSENRETYRFILFTTQYLCSPVPLFSVCYLVSPQKSLKFSNLVAKCMFSLMSGFQ